MDEANDSENDEVVTKTPRTRIHKRRVSSSDSDDQYGRKRKIDDNKTPQLNKINASRRSERIRSRSNRKFSMPSRQDVLAKCTSKNYKQLEPKKLVDDFSRINTRYNSENIDLFEDSSMSDFIEDDSDSSDNSSSNSEAQKPHRVKNLVKRKSRNRIRNSDDSSSDSDNEIMLQKNEEGSSSLNNDNKDVQNNLAKQGASNDKTTQCSNTDGEEQSKRCYVQSGNDDGSGDHDSAAAVDDDDDDDDDIKMVRKRNVSSSLLDSDDSENKDSNCGHSLRKMDRKTVEKRNLLFKGLREARAKHMKSS